jgi:hypothetical protein
MPCDAITDPLWESDANGNWERLGPSCPSVVKLKIMRTWHRMELRHAGKADVVLERVAFARMNQGSKSWRSGPNSAALTGDFWERIFNLSVVVLLALAATAKFLATGSNAQFWRCPTRCCSRRPTGRVVRPPGDPNFRCVTPGARRTVMRMRQDRRGRRNPLRRRGEGWCNHLRSVG